MKKTIVFENHEVEITEQNGETLFEIYSLGMALGYVEKKLSPAGEKLYPRRDRINKNIKNSEIQPFFAGEKSYINLRQLNNLVLEAKADKVKIDLLEKFKVYITDNFLQINFAGENQKNLDDLGGENQFPCWRKSRTFSR